MRRRRIIRPDLHRRRPRAPEAPLASAGDATRARPRGRRGRGHRRRRHELFAGYPQHGGRSWKAGSGAIWNLRSDHLRPAGWTSADAAGLPILPGLARYDEVRRGSIDHALRFTVSRTRRAYVYPARHYASDANDPSLPPMGLRVRLKANVNISHLPN